MDSYCPLLHSQAVCVNCIMRTEVPLHLRRCLSCSPSLASPGLKRSSKHMGGLVSGDMLPQDEDESGSEGEQPEEGSVADSDAEEHEFEEAACTSGGPRAGLG